MPNTRLFRLASSTRQDPLVITCSTYNPLSHTHHLSLLLTSICTPSIILLITLRVNSLKGGNKQAQIWSTSQVLQIQKCRCLYCILSGYYCFPCSLYLTHLLNFQIKKNYLGVSAIVRLLTVAKSEFWPGYTTLFPNALCLQHESPPFTPRLTNTSVATTREDDEQPAWGKGIFTALPCVTWSCSWTPVSWRMLPFSVHVYPGHWEDIWSLQACTDHHEVLRKPSLRDGKTFVWRHKRNPGNPRHRSTDWLTTYLLLSQFPPYISEED